MKQKPRNPVARSPIMKKGGVHEKSRSSERRQEDRAIEDGLDAWAEDSEKEKARSQS